ncbi:hypothetical protein D1007_39276 [Hordeum vulgare]|nr:hypothetical protein D1007_39276 [Hordeum vulgare]
MRRAAGMEPPTGRGSARGAPGMDAPVCPCIGSEQQAVIPNLSTEDECHQLMTSTLGSVLPGFDYPVTIGLAIPVTWKPSEVRKEQELETVDQFTPLPCASTSLWSGIEAECFLLGLYIFGKNPSLLSRFVCNKTIGDVLSYYHGKFYKSDAYRRWLDCRKAGTRRCILGEHIFKSWRQQEIISRLKSAILNEAHDSLVEIFKSFNDGQTYLEDFVFALKFTVGTEALVEAVGIGKGKRDLTGFVLRPSKPNHGLPRFTIIDTTLVQGQEPFTVREQRRLPADAKVCSVPSCQSRKVVNVSSSKESDADGRLYDQEDRGQDTADVNDTETFSVLNVNKETQVDSLQNMVTASCSDFPVNGYSCNASGNIIDLTCLFEPKTKTGRHSKLSPVPKRRKLSSCNNDRTSRHSFPFSKGVGSAKEKIEPLSTSSKPTVGDVSGNSQMKEKTKPLSTSSKPTVGDGSGNSQIKEKIKPLSTSSKQIVGDVSGNSQIKEKIKPLSTSSKPTAGDVSGNSEIKTVARYSTEKPREQRRGASNTLTNDRSSEKMKVKKLYEDKSFERKVDALPEVHSKITSKVDALPEVHSEITNGEAKFAKGAQASSSVGQVKQETPHDSMTGATVCVTLPDDDDYMMAEEAPPISSSDQVRDPEVAERPIAMERPASPQPDMAPQADSWRHGTRNRPPTAGGFSEAGQQRDLVALERDQLLEQVGRLASREEELNRELQGLAAEKDKQATDHLAEREWLAKERLREAAEKEKQLGNTTQELAQLTIEYNRRTDMAVAKERQMQEQVGRLVSRDEELNRELQWLAAEKDKLSRWVAEEKVKQTAIHQAEERLREAAEKEKQLDKAVEELAQLKVLAHAKEQEMLAHAREMDTFLAEAFPDTQREAKEAVVKHREDQDKRGVRKWDIHVGEAWTMEEIALAAVVRRVLCRLRVAGWDVLRNLWPTVRTHVPYTDAGLCKWLKAAPFRMDAWRASAARAASMQTLGYVLNRYPEVDLAQLDTGGYCTYCRVSVLKESNCWVDVCVRASDIAARIDTNEFVRERTEDGTEIPEETFDEYTTESGDEDTRFGFGLEGDDEDTWLGFALDESRGSGWGGY